MNIQDCQVRAAQIGDSKAVWEIRNHPDVCAVSRNAQPIPYEQHEPWFQAKYFSSGSENICKVLDCGGKVAGYCRFDHQDDGKWVISIAVHPTLHGRGLGSTLLQESLEQVGDKPLAAEIQKGNRPSLKLFQKFGFRIDREDEDFYYLSL